MEGTTRSAAAPAFVRRRQELTSEPLVSVVIPTFNRAPSLRRLLAALRRAVVPPGGMEIVVVDDGSADDTAAVAAEAGARYLYQPNSGPAAARERGWRASSGDFIVFIDDDVIPAPDAIVRLVSALGSADGVGAHIVPVDTGSRIAHYMHVDGLVNHRVVDHKVHWLVTATAAFRREALERVGGFDLGFPRAAGEDVDLSLRLLEESCELRVESTAIVQHDHRSRFRDLLRTCHRYGSAYKLLAARHAAHRATSRRAALLRLNLAEWVRVYRGYRREASALRSLVFIALHAIVVFPYAVGVLRGTTTGGRTTNAEEVHLVGRSHGEHLTGTMTSDTADLIGAAQSNSAA